MAPGIIFKMEWTYSPIRTTLEIRYLLIIFLMVEEDLVI